MLKNATHAYVSYSLREVGCKEDVTQKIIRSPFISYGYSFMCVMINIHRIKSKKVAIFSLSTQYFYTKSLANLHVKDLLLISSMLLLDKQSIEQFLCPQRRAAKFSEINHFNGLQQLYGYPKYERDGCSLSQQFQLIW